MAKFTGCLSEETSRRMTLGVMMVELGVGEQDITCMSAGLEVETQTFVYQIFRAAFDCLSETAVAEMFGDIEQGGGPSIKQFKCLFESADDATIVKLFATGAGAGLPPDLLDIIARCGPLPGRGEGSGPPELTPEQGTCVIEALGETAFGQLFTGERAPTLQEIQNIEKCGVPIGPGASEDLPR